MGVSTTLYILNNILPEGKVKKLFLKYGDGTLYPDETKEMNRAFMIHAAFSMAWLVLSYVQIVHTQGRTPKLHRRLGWITATVFACHSLGNLYIVYVNAVGHTAVVRLMFVSTALSHCRQFFEATYHAAAGRPGGKQRHRDAMVLMWFGSIVGAGIIRNIAGVQTFLKKGPAICQIEAVDHMATECQPVYMNRLVLVLLASFWLKGLYVAMPDKAHLVKAYDKEAITVIGIAAVVIAFSYVPNAAQVTIDIFGAPASAHNMFLTAGGSMFFAIYELMGAARFLKEEKHRATITTGTTPVEKEDGPARPLLREVVGVHASEYRSNVVHMSNKVKAA